MQMTSTNLARGPPRSTSPLPPLPARTAARGTHSRAITAGKKYGGEAGVPPDDEVAEVAREHVGTNGRTDPGFGGRSKITSVSIRSVARRQPTSNLIGV